MRSYRHFRFAKKQRKYTLLTCASLLHILYFIAQPVSHHGKSDSTISWNIPFNKPGMFAKMFAKGIFGINAGRWVSYTESILSVSPEMIHMIEKGKKSENVNCWDIFAIFSIKNTSYGFLFK